MMNSIAIKQAGTIALHEGRVCLITSSNRRRWVIPKGMIDDGHTAQEAAVIEAWEEAGLIGDLDPAPIGDYTYSKRGMDLTVAVFRLHVTEIFDDWPECEVRDREWLLPELAAERVEEDDLRELLLAEAD